MSVCGSISAAKPDRPVSPCLPEDGRELRIPTGGARKPLGMVQAALESLDSAGPRAVISRGEAGGTRGAVPLRNATPRRKRPGLFLFREWAIWGFEGLGQRHPGNRAILKGIGRCGGPPRRLPRLAVTCQAGSVWKEFKNLRRGAWENLSRQQCFCSSGLAWRRWVRAGAGRQHG